MIKKIGIIAIITFALLALGCENPDGEYSVIYHGNGNTSGYPPVDNNKYTTGEVATVLGRHTLIKTGYTFQCWNTKADGTGTQYNENDKLPIKNLTVFLYAQWDAD